MGPGSGEERRNNGVQGKILIFGRINKFKFEELYNSFSTMRSEIENEVHRPDSRKAFFSRPDFIRTEYRNPVKPGQDIRRMDNDSRSHISIDSVVGASTPGFRFHMLPFILSGT